MSDSPLSVLQQAYARALEDDGGYITLVGDLIIDQWIRGYVDRMSPEDPNVPVLMQDEGIASLGGAGLVYQNLKAMGPPLVKFVSVRGWDHDYEAMDAGKLLADPHVHLVEDQKRPATLKSRIIIRPLQQIVRVDRESREPISGRVQAEVIRQLHDLIGPDCRMVVVSDYGKGVITEAVMETIRKCCARRKVPFIVDPAKRSVSLYNGARLLTPNSSEFAYLKNEGLLDAGATCVTTGAYGMELYRDNRYICEKYPATDDECVDAIGAGDVVIAAIAVFLSGGAGLEIAVQMANAIAGWYVAQKGPISPTPADVEKLISAHAPFFKIEEKVDDERKGSSGSQVEDHAP